MLKPLSLPKLEALYASHSQTLNAQTLLMNPPHEVAAKLYEIISIFRNHHHRRLRERICSDLLTFFLSLIYPVFFDLIVLDWYDFIDFWVLDISVVVNFIPVCCLNGLIN